VPNSKAIELNDNVGRRRGPRDPSSTERQSARRSHTPMAPSSAVRRDSTPITGPARFLRDACAVSLAYLYWSWLPHAEPHDSGQASLTNVALALDHAALEKPK
jgi:hypothetical protein